MLQQILRDMYVDPEILAELPEEQKEMLFYKIRQEQIRRYKEREGKENHKKQAPRQHKRSGIDKKVRILEDAEGNPWTWVFGENDEITAEEKWQSLSEERIDAAIKAVIQEEEQILRAQIKASLPPSQLGSSAKTNLLTVKQVPRYKRSPSPSPKTSPNSTPVLKRINRSPRGSPVASPVVKRKDARNKQSNGNGSNGNVQIVRVKTPPSPGTRSKRNEVHHTKLTSPAQSKEKHVQFSVMSDEAESKRTNNLPKENILRTLQNTNGSKRVPASERKVPQKSPTTQFLSTDEQNKGYVEDEQPDYEELSARPSNYEEVISNDEWNQQLRRFKEEDEKRRSRARRTSIEYKRQSRLATSGPIKLKPIDEQFGQMTTVNKFQRKPTLPPKPPTLRTKHPVPRKGHALKPRNRQESVQWFQDTQLWLYNLKEQQHVPGWFHGIIARAEAESLLENRYPGDFLIRVSDKIWGYALSYKDEDRIKHFLIDASEAQCYHFFGNDQIRHESLQDLLNYHKQEVISYNGEKLKNWVGQRDLKNPDYGELNSLDEDTLL
ncbi:SH2 domain-containing protein 4A-like isoform X2 [Clavelina lepadiformis]|uniref:SH2 domain-containing protein n=1 Tax=Clavelina lepadiformis TaxID=159417 RepID=A0ABP0FVR5_CLALP